MFYLKNLPAWERAARVIVGLGMVAGGLSVLGATIGGYVLAGMGVMTALSGFAGFCPMCAMVGRKLKTQS